MLPGVLILGSLAELAAQLLAQKAGGGWRLARAEQVRFRHFVQPGDQMELSVELKESRRPPPAERIRARRGRVVATARKLRMVPGRRDRTMRRVAITGIGLVTPLGLDASSTWQGLLDGRSAVGPVRGFDASSLRTQLAAEIAGFDAKPFLANRRVLRMMTRSDQLAVAGASLAVKDSGLDFAARDRERCGLFVAGNKETSKLEPVLEGLIVTRRSDGVADLGLLGQQAGSVLPPLFFVEGLQASTLFYISEAYGLKGANTYFAGTAEAGATAVGAPSARSVGERPTWPSREASTTRPRGGRSASSTPWAS